MSADKIKKYPTSFSLDPRLTAVLRARAASVGIGPSDAIGTAVTSWLAKEFGLSLVEIFAEGTQYLQSNSSSDSE